MTKRIASPQVYDVLILRGLEEGLSYREISARIGLSISTISYSIKRMIIRGLCKPAYVTPTGRNGTIKLTDLGRLYLEENKYDNRNASSNQTAKSTAVQ